MLPESLATLSAKRISRGNLSCVSNHLRKLRSKNLSFFYGRRHGQEIRCVGEKVLWQWAR